MHALKSRYSNGSTIIIEAEDKVQEVKDILKEILPGAQYFEGNDNKTLTVSAGNTHFKLSKVFKFIN